MNPLQILIILKARWKIAMAVFFLSLIAGAIAIWQLPKRYDSTASVVFDVKQQDPVAGMIMPIMPGYLATQVAIINSDKVAKRIVKALRLDESPAVKEQWLEATQGRGKLEDWAAKFLQRGLQVVPSRESNIIDINYRAGDPVFSATVANAYAQAYIDANIELKVDPARQTNIWFGEQAKALREALEKAQTNLSEFQKSKGLIAKDEQLDAETQKLNDLMGQLTAIQAQTADATSKQRSTSMDTLPDVMQSAVVANLRSEIARKEASLQETAGNLGRNHPNYQRMETEIAALKKQLVAETRNVAASFGTSRAASREKESEIRSAIAVQRKKLLSLKDDRDQLAVLQRDVAAAQNTYESVVRRYNQTNLESQITQTNVSVLNPAVAPLEPASPNVPKIAAMTVFFGLLLGGVAAFLLELIDRRVRSASDLAEMLQVPVLAVIETHRPSLGFHRVKTLPAPT